MQLAERKGGIRQNQTNQLRKTPKHRQPALSREGGIGEGTSGADLPGQARAAARSAQGCHRHLLTPSGQAPCPALRRSVTCLLHINPKLTNLGASAIAFTFFACFHLFAPAWRAERQGPGTQTPAPAPHEDRRPATSRQGEKSSFRSQSNHARGLFLVRAQQRAAGAL